jgi:hypothetical protein
VSTRRTAAHVARLARPHQQAVTERPVPANPQPVASAPTRTAGQCPGGRNQSVTDHAGNQFSEPWPAQAGYTPGRMDVRGRRLGLGLGPGGIVCVCTAERLHSLVGEILAAVLIVGPLVTGAVLLTVVVFGSNKSIDRIFRLLRWFRDKEEPPEPANPEQRRGERRSR